MNCACTPNGANASFVPGERSLFKVVASTSTVLPDATSALHVIPRQFRLHASSKLCGSSRWRADRGGRPVLPPQASKQKNPAERTNRAAGCEGGPRRKEGHHPPGRVARRFHQRR